MDFIEQLPLSNGYTTILVIIDHLSKEGVFIPTVDTATSIDVAEVFITHVFAKHGILLHISSDRGSKFTSHSFIPELYSRTCCRLCFPHTQEIIRHMNSSNHVSTY